MRIRKLILFSVAWVIFAVAVGVIGLTALRNSMSSCDVPIACVDQLDGRNSLIWVHAKGKWRQNITTTTARNIVAYDEKNDNWICADGKYGCEKRLKVVNHGRVRAMKLHGMPNRKILACRAVGDTLYAIYISGTDESHPGDDSVGLAALSFDGHLKYEHELQGTIYSEISREPDFSVARDGTIALVVQHKGKYSDLCIFNAEGKLVKRIDYGLNPCFDPSGTRLVMFDRELRGIHPSVERDQQHPIEYGIPVSDYRGSDTIFILDIRTGRKKMLDDIKDSIWGGTIAGCSVCGPGHIRWSPDGKWLICQHEAGGHRGLNYRTELYAADLRRKSPTWKQVTCIRGYNAAWLPLTKEQMKALQQR